MSKLLSVEIEGFGIYKDKQIIDFSKLPDDCTIGIFGENNDGDGGYDSNGSGKSTFTNAISWCLFEKIPVQGESTRVITKEQIVNRESKKAIVTLNLLVNNSLIQLETSMTLKGSKKVRLLIDDRPFLGTDTQIRDKFYSLIGIGGKDKGNFNDFLNRCYFSGDVTKSFASKNFSDANRLAIVSKVRKLEIYDIAIKNSKNQIDQIKQVISELSNFRTNLLAQIKDADLEKIQEEILNLSGDYEQKTILKEEISDELTKYEKVGTLNNKRKELVNQLTNFKREIDQQYKSVELVVTKLNGYSERLIELKKNKSLMVYDVTSELTMKALYDKLSKEIIEHTLTIQKFDIENQSINAQIRDIEEQHYLHCPSCNAELLLDEDNLVEINLKGLEMKKESLFKTLNKNSVLKDNNLIKIQEKTTELNQLSIKIKEIDEKKTKTNLIDKELTKINSEFEPLKEQYKEFIFEDKGILYADSSICEYNSYQEVNELNIEIEKIDLELNEISNIKYTVNDLNDVNKSLSNILNLMTEKEMFLTSQTNLKDELTEVEQSLNPHLENKEMYEYWYDSFWRLKNIELIEVEPILENATNNILQRVGTNILVNYHVDVEKAGLLINLIEDSGNELPLELFSTGQSNRIGFAAGLALSEISLNSNSDYGFSMWDEVFDGLDNTGQDMFFDVLRDLKGIKLIISHDKKLQNMFEYKLKVIRKDHSSKIVLET